jgi:hypothetical protein
MKRAVLLLLLGFGALACSPNVSRTSAADQDKKDAKGSVVDFDGLTSTTPADWKEEPVGNSPLRYMQFRLPKVKEDKQDAEVVIFRGIGGSADANIKRWKDMFIPPEGKSIDDVAKTTEMKVGSATVTVLDVSGTYLYKARPFDPNAKAEKMPNYRMVGAVFEGPKNPYHIRMVGPADTIERYKKGYDEWLKGFK